MNIIKTSQIPPAKTTRGKPSKIPELLKLIPAGQTGELTPNDKEYKQATVRSYIEKQHKQKPPKLLNYTVESRTINKQKILYIKRAEEPKCKETAKTATPA